MNAKIKTNNYIFWKWSINNGEKVEKSFRRCNIPIDISNIKEDISRENPSNTYYNPQDVILETDQKMAHAQSMECDSINWSESNDILFLEHQLKLASNNRREESYNKIAEREMVSQIGFNPFLQQNNTNNDSYIQDVINRDLFMKPINTNIEKNTSDNNNNNLV
jgi:hypothetical protein